MRAAASSRRRFLVTGGGTALLTALSLQASAKDPDPACPKCRGRGVVPLVRPKPYVFLEGSGSFRPADAVFAQFCPTCQPMADKDLLIQEVARQHETVLLKHKEWEERTGWRLVLVQTRHVTIHTQHQPSEARRMGQAVEALTIHLQKTTGSLELTATQPGFYQQMLLFGEDSWEKFRKVMEGLYTPEQLGEPWQPARQSLAYDFPDVPHAYVQPERIRELPPEYQAVKFAATRSMMLATNWKAPNWLWEGMGSYGQQAALGDVRISTVYSSDRGPKARYTFRDARQQAVHRRLRPWPDMVGRDLRDFEGADYTQSMGMVAFLLDTEPARFLDLLRLLKAGQECQTALEETYGKELTELGQASAKWLIRG